MQKKSIMMLLALACALMASATVRLPQLFQSGMVVQRGKPIPVWGWADAGEQVSLQFNKKTYTTTADEQGRWRVDLPSMKAGGPYVLTVNDLTLTDVLVGDVWLCSGQSNIDVTVERVYPQYTKEIDAYKNDRIRLFRVQNETSTQGVKDDIRPTAINWKPVTKENAWTFSAVGYFLGKRMFEKSRVPQGIIVNSWGGTPIEAWISADSLKADFPQMVARTQLYQNADMVAAQQRANQLMDQHWNELLNAADPGMQTKEAGASPLFTAADYDDADWATVDQYDTNWAKTGGRGIVGSIWLRQHVTVDQAHAGKPARLLLGTLFDADYTYLNGREIGRTYYQYPPRRYDIPEGLLREGDNVLTVRFINKYGVAHFIKEKPYLIAFGDDRFSQNPLPADTIGLSPKWKHHAGADMPACPSGDVALQNLPSTLYNAVLHPLAPYALAGVVWYQGESNTGNPAPYETLLTKLVGNWRARWNQPALPFVVVQLANHMQPSEQPQQSNWAQLREAQRQVARKLPNVELATAIDLGETVDIHPLRKKELAERIGIDFDRLVYKDKKVKLMPELVGYKVEDNLVTLTFDQPLKPGELNEFEVAGADGRFVNASATASGNAVTVTSIVAQPKRVRHAWKDNPIRFNAYAASGLPLSPFEILLK